MRAAKPSIPDHHEQHLVEVNSSRRALLNRLIPAAVSPSPSSVISKKKRTRSCSSHRSMRIALLRILFYRYRELEGFYAHRSAALCEVMLTDTARREPLRRS